MPRKSGAVTLIGKYIKSMSRGAGIASFLILLLMMLLGVANVVGDFLKYPIPGAVEWTEVLMVFVIFLAVIWVTDQKGHITVTILNRYLSERVTRVTDLLVLTLVAFFFGIMAWQLSIFAVYSVKQWEYTEVIINVYWFPAKIAAAVGCILTVIVLIFQIVQSVAALRHSTIEKTGAS